MMCTVCGCQSNHDHRHGHSHDHDHGSGLPASRLIEIEQDILGRNNRDAALNRARFADAGILALNLMSSPGSGKTTVLCRTVQDLSARFGAGVPLAVIEGDQQTSHDADRIRATGIPAWQINTGKGCHLDAHGVGHAYDALPAMEDGVLFIENVGNLVCPAAFDLGEAHKVVILSVTEGEDKPLKYPDMFAAASLMLLNKSDLLPHLDFDAALCIDYARRVNPSIQVLTVSARSGEGMEAWYDWIEAERRVILTAKIAQLQARLDAVRGRLGGVP